MEHYSLLPITTNDTELYRHYKAVAEAVDLPQILYNIPGRTGVNMLPATIARLAARYCGSEGGRSVQQASGLPRPAASVSPCSQGTMR